MRVIDLLEKIANGDSIPNEMYFRGRKILIRNEELYYVDEERGVYTKFFRTYDCGVLFEKIKYIDDN